MDEQDALMGAVAALTRYFLGDATMREALTKVSELAQAAVVTSHQVAITMQVDDKPGTFVFTDPEIPTVDQAQYDTGDGPCLEAWATGEVVLVSSTRSSARYPHFCSVAADHGIFSVVSFPLTTSNGPFGAMNHYAAKEHAFGPAEIEIGRRFADQASYLLLNAQAHWDGSSLDENLADATASRALIEQAKGVIIASFGCTEAEAFAHLTAQSRDGGVGVRELALEVVRRAQRSR